MVTRKFCTGVWLVLLLAFATMVFLPAAADVWDEWDYPGGKRTLKIWINGGSQEFKDAVKAAIDNWNHDENNGNWTLEEGTEADHDVSVRMGNLDGPEGALGETKVTYNRTTHEASKVSITIDSEEDWGDGPEHQNLERAIKHELGHAQRMDDTDEEGDLLNGAQGNDDDNLEPSDHDKSEARASYTISGNELDTPGSLVREEPMMCSIYGQPGVDLRLPDAEYVSVMPLQPANLTIGPVAWDATHIEALFLPGITAFHNEAFIVKIWYFDGSTAQFEDFVTINDVPPPPNALPHAEAGPNEIWVESGEPFTLNGSGSWHDNPLYTSSLVHIWRWDDGPGMISVCQSEKITQTLWQVGEYLYTLQVEDLFTRVSVDTVKVHVMPVSSIDRAKQVPDGTVVSFFDICVTGFTFGDNPLGPGIVRNGITVEKFDRSCGIRVITDAFANRGDVVQVSGVTATLDGERVIIADSVSVSGTSNPIPLFDITNLDSGGGTFGYQGSVVNDAFAVPPVMATGANNVGILMRLRGKVRSVVTLAKFDLSYFYVDDGYTDPGGGFETGLKDGSYDSVGKPNIGVRCSLPVEGPYPDPTTAPPPDSYVEVTGVMGVRQVAGRNIRYFYTHKWALASFQELQGQRWPKWNLLSLPGKPRNPDPAAVFAIPPSTYDPMLIDGVLLRWDGPTQGLIAYDMWSPEIFGAIWNVAGCWLKSPVKAPILYVGYDVDSIPPRDVWIAAYKGWNILGVPFMHCTNWADWRATDVTSTKSIYDACQYPGSADWLQSIGYWWDPVTQGMCDYGLPDDFPTTDKLCTWYGYWFKAKKNLGMFAPNWSIP